MRRFLFFLVFLSNLRGQEGQRNDINIRELLMLSGQNPSQFSQPPKYTNPNNFPEVPPPNDFTSIDYDSNLYKQLITNGRKPRPGNNPNDIVMHEKTIDNLLGFVKGVILCGGDGWCGTRCCAGDPMYPDNPHVQYRPPGGSRRKQKNCYPVCQPLCAPKCIEAAKILMQTRTGDNFKLSGIDLEPEGKTLVASIPLCRPACMPACRESCLKKKQRPMKVTCRPACMPECTPTCVASPPLMVPCTGSADKECSCPPGYVTCSKFTCCMRYRTMAVRYRKLLPGYLYADNSTLSHTNSSISESLLSSVTINETLHTAGNLFSSFTSFLSPGNQTTVYLNALKNMNSTMPNKNLNSVDYEVVYDYDENVDSGKPEFDAVTVVP
ncbi:hypothetical protein FO519_004609 [Halicephalobus sp. NKZ332]|nr:hypothetical protein FO519_004609 [Halicephalobus sp. NKZ332]